MTAVASERHETRAEPLFKLPHIPWPPGTTWFALRTWVALGVALWAAFFLELEGASSAGVCVLILAQPVQGMVLSKTIYRIAGTLAGVTAAIILTALFPQDRTMLLAGFAVWMGLLTAGGTLLRDFRAYGCILSGYTVAIISIADIDTPGDVFTSAINRVAAILVGVAAIGLVNGFMATAESSRSLRSKLRDRLAELLVMTRRTLDQREPLDPETCIDLAAKIMPLRSEISFAQPELPDGRKRARGGRSALLGLLELINAINAVGVGLRAIAGPSEAVDAAVGVVRKALRLQEPERCLADLDAIALPRLGAGTLSIDEAFAIDRMRFMINNLGNIRDGLRSVRLGVEPRRRVALPVHQDYVAVVFNAVRVMVSLGIVAVLAVWSGLPETATAILFTAVFVSLGAVTPNPMIMGKAALYGMPAVVVAGTLYVFFVLPVIAGFPLFILALAPLVVAMCWLTMIGMPGAGLIFTVQAIVLISPANPQVYSPATFVDTATMLTVSGIAIFLSFLLVLPVDPAQRRLRLALAVGRNLREALADKGKLTQPRASLHFDRLSQFKTWQGRRAVTPVRHATMTRLVDIGRLAYAVRRSWRALDRSRPYVDRDLDARARNILPSLSPDETEQLAHTYLAQAVGKEGQAALDLAFAAAALHGTAYVTTTEMRLLRHVELLRRKI